MVCCPYTGKEKIWGVAVLHWLQGLEFLNSQKQFQSSPDWGLLGSLYGKRLFCVLDLCSGNYQIPLEVGSRDKTSCNTRFGSYRWTRLAMGLCTEPATFQRAMQLVLRGMTWEQVIVYLDDIIVLGTDFSNALAVLRNVFIQFRQHNHKFKVKR